MFVIKVKGLRFPPCLLFRNAQFCVTPCSQCLAAAAWGWLSWFCGLLSCWFSYVLIVYAKQMYENLFLLNKSPPPLFFFMLYNIFRVNEWRVAAFAEVWVSGIYCWGRQRNGMVAKGDKFSYCCIFRFSFLGNEVFNWFKGGLLS